MCYSLSVDVCALRRVCIYFLAKHFISLYARVLHWIHWIPSDISGFDIKLFFLSSSNWISNRLNQSINQWIALIITFINSGRRLKIFFWLTASNTGKRANLYCICITTDSMHVLHLFICLWSEWSEKPSVFPYFIWFSCCFFFIVLVPLTQLMYFCSECIIILKQRLSI